MPEELTLPALLTRRALEHGSLPAITVLDGGGVLTFAEWDLASHRVAHGLRAQGLNPGDRLILECAPARWIDYAVAWVGALRAGAEVIPMPESRGSAFLVRVATMTGAVGVIGERCVYPEAWHATVRDLSNERPTDPIDKSTPFGPSEILFTSGTTGTPRGVEVPQANWLAAIDSGPATGNEWTHTLHALPPGLTTGQWLLVQLLAAKPHRMTVLPVFNPTALMFAVDIERPDTVVLVPAQTRRLLHDEFAAGTDPTRRSSVRVVRSVTAAITAAELGGLAAMFPPPAVVTNVYTSTECAPARVTAVYDPQRPGAIGLPTGGSQLRIVNDDGTEVAPGEPGWILLRSDAPPRGYLDHTDADTFAPTGWVKTGDVGQLDEDGYLFILGRADDRLTIGGEKVWPEWIAEVLRGYPGVVDVAVLPQPHDTWGQVPVAVIEAGPQIDVTGLLAYARRRLRLAAPVRLAVVTSLPRLPSGKVSRDAVRELLASLDLLAPDQSAGDQPRAIPSPRDGSAPPDSVDPVAEVREVFAVVSAIWAQVLGLPELPAAHEHFFDDHSGDSYAAAEVIAQMATQLDRDLPDDVVDVCPTLSALVLRVAGADKAQTPAHAWDDPAENDGTPGDPDVTEPPPAAPDPATWLRRLARALRAVLRAFRPRRPPRLVRALGGPAPADRHAERDGE